MKIFGQKLALIVLGVSAACAQAGDLRVLSGLKNPESALAGSDGRIYVSQIGAFDKDGDGSLAVIGKDGKLEIFAKGLDDPKGLAQWKGELYAADKTRIWKIDARGNAVEWVRKSDFPEKPQFLNDLVFDSKGNLYVSDTGDLEKGGGVIFKITPQRKVTLVILEGADKRIKAPNGLLMEGDSALLVLDFLNGELNRLDLRTLKLTRLAGGFGGGDGLARDKAGVLYISDWKGGRVWSFNPRQKNSKPVLYQQNFVSAADITLDSSEKFILVPDMKAGTLTWLPVQH
ncbi:MAG: SMP-30/gluconolactonase/LRE family protein [Burkholderiales bacterium]